jgi:hypothetical protein
MKTWFACKVKYQKQDEKGKVKNVSEQYLVDAVSFTEAESRMYEKMGELIQGEFYVSSISKSNFTDVFYYEDAETWHKCKMTYVLEVEGSGKEKKVTNYVLLTAPDVKTAYDRVYESLNNMLVDFRVPEISESPILEVFPYESNAEEKWQEAPDNCKPIETVDEDQQV